MAGAAGVDRAGIARVHPVPGHVTDSYMRWLAAGRHAGMEYLERHTDIRRDPALLLDGAQSIISCAVSYNHSTQPTPGLPTIARYAQGDDYHEVVRAMLETLAAGIRESWGGQTRVCVDTAPIHERYWAVEAGVGRIGANSTLIVPGLGSWCFLGEVLTTVAFEPTLPLSDAGCDRCGRCTSACPTGAIGADGHVDARRCLSYLTIEHRGPLPDGLDTGGRLFGCDTCQQVCPHNNTPGIATDRHAEFSPRPAYAALTADAIEAMTQEGFSRTFRHSAIKRAKLEGLKRNIKHI